MAFGKTQELLEDVNKCVAGETSESLMTKELKQENCVELAGLTGFACDVCSKVFQSKHSRNRHLLVHNNKDCVCRVCNKVCTSKPSLYRHLNRHKKSYKCNICDKSFSETSSLRVHQLYHSNERKHSCEICNKAFKQLEHLKKHYLTHTKEKPYACDVCYKGFASRHGLNVHLLSHPQSSSANRQSYICEICNKSFPIRHRLTQHLFCHSDEKPYTCEICNKNFRRKYQLTMHLKKHSGEKLNKGKRETCEICNRTVLAVSFRKHLKIHFNEKTHICHICNRAFLQKAHLQGHLPTHTGERPFSCEICKKTFTRKSHLKIHLKTHANETVPYVNPFSCITCKKNFTRREHMDFHMLTHAQALSSSFDKDFCEKQSIETDICKESLPINQVNQELQTRYFCQKWNIQVNHGDTNSAKNLLKWELCKETFATEAELKQHLLSHSQASSFSISQSCITEDHPTESDLKRLESMNFY